MVTKFVLLFLVDGNWSIWSPWEVCTAACGKMGLTNRSRACVDPVPQNGGKMCSGSHFESKLCISTSCPGLWLVLCQHLITQTMVLNCKVLLTKY